MSNIAFQNDYIAVKEIKEAQSGGLFIELNSADHTGIVKYVGAKVTLDLKVGQQIYFSATRTPVTIENENLWIIKQADVYGIKGE